MTVLCRWFVAAVWFVMTPVLAAPAQVFLIQNSGWMEPFYADPTSRFKPLAQTLIQTVARSGDDVIVAAFNQSVGAHRSPQLMYRGPEPAAAAVAVTDIQLARKPNSTTYADTDLKEAIATIATEHLKAAPAVIWILTNNRNSPGNDPNTAARNREFYELLHLDPSVARTLAWPLGMPVQGRLYSARGLMVYALAYGTEAETTLRRMLAEGLPGRIFTEPPARLKPLNRDSVIFIPRSTTSQGVVRISLGPDGKTLVLGVEAGSSPAVVEISGAFRNEFYPYDIRAASLAARLVWSEGSGNLQVVPARLDQPLPPGTEVGVTVRLPLPAIQMPSVWSPTALAQMGTEYVIQAALHVTLANQQLQVSDGFVRRVGTIFPGDPLSAVFQPSDQARASETVIPVQIRVVYPLYPLLLMAGGVLTLVGAAIAAGVLLSRERRYELLVNGEPHKVAIRPLHCVKLKSPDGRHIATLRRGLGAPAVAWQASGTEVHIKNRP